MSLLSRGPDGKFCGRSGALWVWMPVLLKWSSNPIDSGLLCLIRFCDAQAGKCYRMAAEAHECDGSDWRAKERETEAHRWQARKAALVVAREAVRT